jgi:hypothetical protein
MPSDDSNLSKSDAIFARAYASAIKNWFQLDVGEHNLILTSPVTQRGVPAGDLIYPEMTNYVIYKLADNLQYADSPSYTGDSAGSYIQQLNRYAFAHLDALMLAHPPHLRSYINSIKTVKY